MQPAQYPLTPSYAASAYGNPENLVGGHNAVVAPWQIRDRSTWGEREASYYEQIKQEREDNTAAILQYIQNTWNSWVQLVAAPERYDYWRGQKITTRIRVTPMGLLPDQGIPPNVKFTSEITEFELDLVGIGVHWDLAQSNTQRFMTEASAVANLIASFEFTAKQAVIAAIAQRTMNIAEIIAFFKAGQTVTLGAAMQLVNMIFGVANKGGSDLPLLLNKIKEQTERRQTFLNTMLAPSTVIQAPAFINYWDLPRSGTQLRATPELAYKIQGWVENVFEVTGILMSNDRVSSGLSTQYHKGSWFVLKLTGDSEKDFISITSGPDNSMKKLRAADLVKNLLNFDSAGDLIEPEMFNKLMGGRGERGEESEEEEEEESREEPMQLFILDQGISQSYAHGALYNLRTEATFARDAIGTLQSAFGLGAFNQSQTLGQGKLDTRFYADFIAALISYDFTLVGRAIPASVSRPDSNTRNAVMLRASEAVNALFDANSRPILLDVVAIVANQYYGMLSEEKKRTLLDRITENSASQVAPLFSSLAQELKLKSPNLSNEMAILKASLTLNKIVDENQLKTVFSGNKTLKSALDTLRDMGVDQSHIDDHARICTSPEIQKACFSGSKPVAAKSFSAKTFGAKGALDRWTKRDLLAAIRDDGGEALKGYQILIGRQFQEGEGTSMALLEPGGKAVKLYIGQPTFGSGFNSATMMAQATLRMMMGVAVTPTGIATLPHVHLTDFNPKTFGTDIINPNKLREEDGFVQAADGRLGALWCILFPPDVEIPPVWTIKGTYDIPQLENASIEQVQKVPLWQRYLKKCMNYDNQTGLDAMKIDPEAKVINEIMERGVWNIGDQATVNPCDAFGLALSGANSNQYKSGGYSNGVNIENAGYYRLAAVN